MKSASIILMLGSWFAALDPNNNGCGAAAGANQANGAEAPEAGAPATPIDTSGTANVDCGALGKHAFCDDFSGSMPGRFETQEVQTGLVALENGALVASVQKPASGTRTIAQLKKPVDIEGERFRLSFTENIQADCFVGKNTVQSNAILVNGGKYAIAILHGENGDSVLEGNFDNGIYLQAHQLRTPIPHDRTTKITFDLDLDAKTISLEVDGSVVMDREPLKYSVPAPQKATVVAGILIDNLLGPTPCKTTIDDVALDVQASK